MDRPIPEWRTFGEPSAVSAAPPRRFLDHLDARLTIGIGAVGAGLLFALLAAILALAPAPGGVAIAAATGAGTDAGVLAASAVDVVAAVGVGPAPGTRLVVDIEGAVRRPGVVRVAPGSRVGDAIQAAGGFAPRADLAAAAAELNLAEVVADGAKVVVPALGTAHATPVAADPARDERLDLNAADGAALEDLPGIGPVTAGRILDARAQQPFAAVDELRSRGLVGQATFDRLKDLVRVGG